MKKYSVNVRAIVVLEQVIEIEADSEDAAIGAAWDQFDAPQADVVDSDLDDRGSSAEYIPEQCIYCGYDIPEDAEPFSSHRSDDVYCSQECKDFSIDAEREADWYTDDAELVED